MNKNAPIGIFDSGIGGLTVAYQLNQILPNEDFIYFGDTAHLPYGEKSATAIQSYSIKICNLLLEKKCKAILIACNSASAAAFDLVEAYVGKKSLVFNVIDPVVEYVVDHFPNQKIGLIGTRQTILSQVYKKKIELKTNSIDLKAVPTALLASAIEEGFFNNSVSNSLIQNYLSHPELINIQALILGCTHYPLIKNQIEDYYNHSIEIIDSASIVSEHIKKTLKINCLLNNHNEAILPKKLFYVSDYTLAFEEATKIFFREKVELQHYPIWD